MDRVYRERIAKVLYNADEYLRLAARQLLADGKRIAELEGHVRELQAMAERANVDPRVP